MKRWSTWLVIGEMQIKSQWEPLHTHSDGSKGQIITSVGKDMEKLEPPASLEGKQNGAATVENSVAVHLMVKHGVNTQSSNSIPKYISKRYENISPHKICTWVLTAAVLTIAKRWKHKSMVGWADKQNGMLFSHRKAWRTDTRYDMDGPWKHYAMW